MSASDRWSADCFFDILRRQLCRSDLGRGHRAITDAEGAAEGKAAGSRAAVDAMFRLWWTIRNRDIDRPKLQELDAPFRSELHSFCRADAAQVADGLWRRLGDGLTENWAVLLDAINHECIEPITTDLSARRGQR